MQTVWSCYNNLLKLLFTTSIPDCQHEIHNEIEEITLKYLLPFKQ